MCGRYAFLKPPAEVAAHFGLAEWANCGPRHNIPPGTDTPVIRLSPVAGGCYTCCAGA